MPNPPAEFSPFRTVRCGSTSSLSPGRIALTASRPGEPTTSATKRMRKSSAIAKVYVFRIVAWPPTEDWIDPAVPHREELIRFADALRGKLDPGWSAWIEAGDLGPRYDQRVVFHHALTSSMSLNF